VGKRKFLKIREKEAVRERRGGKALKKKGGGPSIEQ